MDTSELRTTSTLGANSANGALDKSAAAPSPDQLRVLAAQFESMLMGQMLKQMQSAMFGDEEDGDTGFASGPLGDTMYAELSQALSKAGGMGLTDALAGPLLRQAEAMSGSQALESGGLDAMMKSFALPEDNENAGFSWGGAPTTLGVTSSAFGWRQDPFSNAMKFHTGTDIAMPVGREVPVAQSGTVAFAGEQPGYGLTVLVEHGPGLATRYAHLSETLVAVGDRVEFGQTIAKSGVSGRVTGPHLHFEVLEKGQPIDPSLGLSRLGTSVQRTD